MRDAIVLFLSQFMLVFVYGVQSQTVRLGAVGESIMLSIAAGVLNLVAYKMAPNASTLEMVAFVVGGVCGIVCSIYAHQHWHFKKYGTKAHA